MQAKALTSTKWKTNAKVNAIRTPKVQIKRNKKLRSHNIWEFQYMPSEFDYFMLKMKKTVSIVWLNESFGLQISTSQKVKLPQVEWVKT